MSAKRVFFFGGGTCEGNPAAKQVLGGKGASLASMCRAELPVPPGFTISAECCPLCLETGRWPEGLEAEVRDHLARLEQATGRSFGRGERPLLVSVRSGAAVSMPGMMDTILNCGINPAMAEFGFNDFWRTYADFISMFARTVADFPPDELDAIAERLSDEARKPREQFGEREYSEVCSRWREACALHAKRPFPTDPWQSLVECIDAVFRSWNSERAVAYRRHHDIRGVVGTAVNVQAMFPSAVSGVVFTTNPTDPGAGEMVIESSWGLGEAVVSGDVAPDRFIVDAKTLAVTRSLIGRKLHMVRALDDRAPHPPDEPSLTPGQITELVTISRRAEALFGVPVDVEFGWADGHFALLQSRPIRGLDVAVDVQRGRREEIDRLRAIAGSRRRVWVRHNLSETLPAPMPLTWDIMSRFMSGDGGFGLMYRDFGYRPSARVRREGFLELICGRIFADPERAAELFWHDMPVEYDLEALAKDPSLIEEPPSRFNADRTDATFLLRLPRTVVAMMRSSKLVKKLRPEVLRRFDTEIVPPYLEYVRGKRGQDLTRMTTAEVIGELSDRRRRVLDEFGNESLKPGFFGGMALESLKSTLVRLLGEHEGTRLSLALTRGLPGDTTVEQDEFLFAVARGEETLDEFLVRYGHRAGLEMELAEPRWREDSSYLWRTVALYREHPGRTPGELHAANEEGRKRAEAELPALLEKWGGTSFAEEIELDLRDAQRLLPTRERGKHFLMMGYELIRLAVMELSRRWELGRDVFFLKLDELARFESQREALAEEIERRKIRWQSAKRLHVDEVVDSDALEELGRPRHYAAARELAGEAVASGVGTGRARVVLELSQARDLGTDYVLVCPSTDPAWTTLFVGARGLVIERGGVLSHGAIVARDFGIPAVVCPDATQRIPDGAKVCVDGDHGTITLIEE